MRLKDEGAWLAIVGTLVHESLANDKASIVLVARMAGVVWLIVAIGLGRGRSCWESRPSPDDRRDHRLGGCAPGRADPRQHRGRVRRAGADTRLATRAQPGPGGCIGALLVPCAQPHECMGQPFRLSGVHLSQFLRLPILTSAGETVGPLEDVVVRLRAGGYPLVIGLVTRVGSARLFVAAAQLAQLDEQSAVLGIDRLDLRGFERRDGELLLRTDILGHRLIDVATAELRRAYDVKMRPTAEGLEVWCLDTRRPARLFGLVARGAGHSSRDWKDFEALIGHTPSTRLRGGFLGARKMKAAQIADLIEQANRVEGQEILQQVHSDPELEADVFEELEPDTATRLFGDRSDAEVADVLSHMRADDAADAVAELPQKRRDPVLEAMPLALRTKVLTLLGFNPESAGGVMNLDVVAVSLDVSVGQALAAVAQATLVQPEALNTVHAVDAAGRLAGLTALVTLVQADPTQPLHDILDTEPVRVGPDTDIVGVALLMADYNLVTVPVVDVQRRLLGVITFDDVLEATIPDDWRRRERPQHPDAEEGEGASVPSSGR